MKFQINKYLSVRLEENNDINIYIDRTLFRQCKYLLLKNLTLDQISDFIVDFKSVDEEAEKLNHLLEVPDNGHEIPPETEFWAHCSNLQVWEENDYDTRLLHSNLSFPLLKRLAEVGDERAQVRFKDELAKTLFLGNVKTVYYLILNGYLNFLDNNELQTIFLDSNANLYRKINNALQDNNPQLKSYALLIMKAFAEIGDVTAKNLIGTEFEKYCSETKFEGMTVEEILFYESSKNSGFYKFIDNESLLNMLLDEKEAKIALRLNKELQERFDLSENFYLQTEYDLTEFSLLLRPTILTSGCDTRLLKQSLKENLIMGIKGRCVAGINLTGGEYLLNLNKFPLIITEFKHLNFLNLSYQYIREIPQEIKNLRSLEILNLSHNRIRSNGIPLEVNTLSNLKRLHLDHNLLTRFPGTIGNFKSLKILNLSNNKLTSLPDSIKYIISLEELYFHKNQLSEIPVCIKEIKSLTVLGLKLNKIQVVPEFLNELKKLKILYIDLERLNPTSLKIVSKLKKKGVIVG